MTATFPDKLALLAREVERLVTAPYAPSLQELYNLTEHASPGLICSWAAHKPCQIGAILDVLVDGLSRSHRALPLIANFARTQSVRNALLEQYPYLLDQFLQRSLEGDGTEYPSVCISLLSSPLPLGFIPPANLAPFIMKMIEDMRKNPSAKTIRHLYLISTCLETSPRVLLEIPQEVMSCFQTELTKTLRNLEDHMGNLLCLATFAKLNTLQGKYTEAENGVGNQPWLQNILHFFGPKRGLKTLDLVFLRVILACSSSCGKLTTEESVESIGLAINICDAVDHEQKTSWIAANSIKIAKLCEKVTRDGIDKSVQMMGITFLVSFIPVTSLSSNLVAISLDCLVSGDSRIIIDPLASDSIPRLVRANAACSGESTVEKVLDYVFSTLSTDTPLRINTANVQVAKLLLSGLQQLEPQSAHLISTEESLTRYRDVVQKLVGGFPRYPPHSRCDGSSRCHASVSRSENELLLDLLTFCLETSLPIKTRHEEFHSAQIATLITFMTKSKKFLPDFKCAFSETRPLDLRASLTTPNLRETSAIPRCDWRSGMRETLIANTLALNDNIIQKVNDICYELEQRCGSIEAPLKSVEEDRDKYSREVEQLKEQNDDLKSALSSASNTIAELRGDMSRLESNANTATERVKDLSASLSQAQRELEELERTSQDAISNERELARTRELDLIATITQKDDRLEELEEEIRLGEEENDSLKIMLTSASREKDSSLADITSLNQQLLTLRTELDKAQALLLQKDENIKQLVTENDNAVGVAKGLQEKLDEKESESESLRSEIQNANEELKTELDALKRQSDLQHSNISEECTKQKGEILSLQRAMHEASSLSRKELQTKEKRIQHLERKVQYLREERAAKAREFSEAQQHISRLMGVMGFKPDPRASSKQRPRSSFDPSQNAEMQTQTNSGEGISQGRDEDSFATSPESNVSQIGRRSPKRSRNNELPLAETFTPHLSSHGTSKKLKDSGFRGDINLHRDRKPLGEADCNSLLSSQSSDASSPVRGTAFRESQFNKGTDHNHLEDVDLDLDLEFSKDFVFNSTSMSEFNGGAHA